MWHSVLDVLVLFGSMEPEADHSPSPHEYGMLEVHTAFCNYLAIEQPSLLDVKAGDELVIEVLHNHGQNTWQLTKLSARVR